MLNIGFGNTVNANRIIAVVSPESAPIKRILQKGTGQRSADRRDVWPAYPGGHHHGLGPCGVIRYPA